MAKIAFIAATTPATVTALNNLMNMAGVIGAVSPDVSDANATRITNYAKATYGEELTAAQAFQAMAAAFIRGAADNVRNHERAEAQSAVVIDELEV